MLLADIGGPFLMTRACVPVMIAQGFGRIVNISTSRSTMVRVGQDPYGPTKAALEASSRIWATELAGTGVIVDVLLPGGPCDTALIPPRGERRRHTAEWSTGRHRGRSTCFRVPASVPRAAMRC